MTSGSDRLSMPEGDDVTISPQDISRWVHDCWRLHSGEEKNVAKCGSSFGSMKHSHTPGSKVYSVYKIFSVITCWELGYK